MRSSVGIISNALQLLVLQAGILLSVDLFIITDHRPVFSLLEAHLGFATGASSW